MKKIYFALLAGLVITSCGQTEKKAETATNGLKETVSIDSLIKNPEAYVGKEIVVKGSVFHTCTETGKRMFVYGTNSDSTIKVVASDSVKTFDKSLEGNDVLIKGVVEEQRIDPAFIAKMEMEAKENEAKSVDKKEKVAGNGHIHEGETTMKQAAALKARLKESGKDYLSFYSLSAYKVEKCCPEGKTEEECGGCAGRN